MKRFMGYKTFPSPKALITILNSMNVCLYVSDLQNGEILFINDRMKERFNLEGDVEGSICWEVLQSGLDKRCKHCPICRLLEDHGIPIVWEDYNTVTGRYYRNTDCIIEWTNGKKVHMQYSTDVTDVKLAEKSLEKRLKQQELMSAISQSFTTSQDTKNLICEALKTAGEFMGVNQAFLAKYQKGEGCLECIYEWCDKEAKPYIGGENKWPISPDMEIYKDLTVNGYAAVNDYCMLTHPNFEKVKEYDLRAFLNIPIEVSGEFWGVIGFIINKQKYEWSKSDIYLGQLIAGVFSGVVSRNIIEENLVKAKEMAEQSSRAKGEFLSSMSHEMRTPMNAIIGMTAIAKNSDDMQKIEHCLEKIDSSSQHLLSLINDILDISKIEANKLELASAEFDFEKMLMNITGVLNFRIEEKKQNLIVNIDKDAPFIFIGDEMRLSQVIMNLLSNAVKFTPEEGTITLNVHNVCVSEGISTLLFEVIDNGIGISEELQTKLFAPFKQADGRIAQKFGGTGLGLTISKGIVELMGGRIWIESKLGQGAKFSFTVKLRIGKEIRRPDLSNLINKGDIRILVIEGTREIKNYFTRIMPELGLSCDVADSEAEALKMISKKIDDPYNIFFIDGMISDLNIIELTRKIKNINSENKVVIMISEIDQDNIEKDALEAGIDKFIFKPIFPSVLIDAINEVMGIMPRRKKPQGKIHTYDFKDHVLLIAEDIEINREIIYAVLEDTKVSVDFAHNGIEVLTMFENDPDRYSAILMDIQMPEMDGYEATRRIRALNISKSEDIPIIAMTANVFREDVDRCILVGMDDHIGKPIEAAEILSKLNKYLNPKHEIIMPHVNRDVITDRPVL